MNNNPESSVEEGSLEADYLVAKLKGSCYSTLFLLI